MEERSFFCVVNLMDSHFMSIGGYSKNKTILKTTEFYEVDRNWTVRYGRYGYGRKRGLSDMVHERSGHGCSLLTNEGTHILVSGGSKIEDGEAMSSSEIYNVIENTWSTSYSMKEPRFGHAVVKIGEKVLAVGGSRLRPDIITDTIENWRKSASCWRF